MSSTTAPSTSTPQPMPDPRPLLAHALDQAGRLVSETSPDRASHPTPCDDYDVAGLIDHVQAVVRRIGVVVSGEPFWTVPQQVQSSDWAADWATGRAETDAALAAADLDAMVQLPWGQAPVSGAIGSYVAELTTHAWDLAVATGRVEQLDPALAEAVLPGVRAQIPAETRGGEIPFGPVVDVPEDAPAYDRLAGWEGRDPAWAA